MRSASAYPYGEYIAAGIHRAPKIIIIQCRGEARAREIDGSSEISITCEEFYGMKVNSPILHHPISMVKNAIAGMAEYIAEMP